MLGRALTALGRAAEAEEILAAALDRLEEGLDPEDELTLRARDAYEALVSPSLTFRRR